MYFAGEKLLYLISFCICPATSFASALNIFHLELSCQVVLYIFPYFLYIVLTPVREYLMKMNFFLLLHYIINHLALTIVLPWCIPELAQHWVQLHEHVFTHWQRSIIQELVILEEGQCTFSCFWEPAESCLGFGSAQHLAGWEPGGTQKALFLSVLSPWVDITSSAAAPGWTTDWLSTLTVKRWGTSWAWYLHLNIFLPECCFPLSLLEGFRRAYAYAA